MVEMLRDLCCPVCYGELELQVEIHCMACHRRYPVQDGIPVLIPARASIAAESFPSVQQESHSQKPLGDLA